MKNSKEDLQKAVVLFSRRHSEDFYRILGRLKILYDNIQSYKITISSTPNKEDIEKITKHLIKIVKFAYMGTVVGNDEAVKFCYLNGNCDYFVGAICAVYGKALGIKPENASKFPTKKGNDVYITPVGRSFKFMPNKENPNTLYSIGFGWKEQTEEYKISHPYVYHRALYLNGEYFDICGGKNEADFKKHLKDEFQTPVKTIFKTSAIPQYDLFTQFLTKCVEVEKTVSDENEAKVLC